MDSHTWYNGILVIFVILVLVVAGSEEPVKCHPDDQQVLIKFKDGRVFDGYESWREGEDCCNWTGVTCNDITGYVVRLDIPHVISGEIPQILGNLSRLEFLAISSGNRKLFPLLYSQHLSVYANSLGWLSSLGALNYLSFSGVDLGKVGRDWMEVLGSFPSLKYLYLDDCNLQEMAPTRPYSNFSSSLSGIHLNYNHRLGPSLKQWLLHSNVSSLVQFSASATNLNGSIADMFFKFPMLEELYLSNNFFAELPASIVAMNNSLKTLDLSDNMITGAIPVEVGLLQNLRVLDLGNHVSPGVPRVYPINRFEGALPDSLCHLQKLVELSLQSNALTGPIPECLGLLPSLGTLVLDNDRLEGNLPATLGQLSRLSTLSLGSNNLDGQVTEGPFQNLTQLALLDISSNSFKIQFPSNWVPPFKSLQILYLDSCLVGPDFPPWIPVLPYLPHLDLSNSAIEGFLPQWFSERI